MSIKATGKATGKQADKQTGRQTGKQSGQPTGQARGQASGRLGEFANMPAEGSPAARILLCLKLSGPQTAAAMGAQISTTGEAVRQQLVRLNEEGLVSSFNVSQGVGRPSLFWQLTEAGHQHFPDRHADLAVQLLQSIRTVLGDEAMHQLMQQREHEMRRTYQARLDGLSLQARIEELVRLRSAEGYMAESQSTPDGDWLLSENHCPICRAAENCQALCQMELALFRDALGDRVVVERQEHILAGDRRCSYRIGAAA